MEVFGKNVALDYLEKEDKINKVYLADNFNDEEIKRLISKRGIKPIVLKRFEMDKKVNGLHQGIILDVPDYEYAEIDEFIYKEDAFVVILDHLEDPHNFGAIIRTCEAAGVDGIIIPKDRSVSVNATVIKTSVGTTSNVKIAPVTNLVNTINSLKDRGFWIIGTDMDGTDYTKIDYKGKIAIICGNEGSGMSRLVRDNCDFIASIPMYGKVNSLNASVATALVIFEANKSRR
ncbi:MAG: 23S rRNA (guanosine(2251)-2'-O)-methyltransferase RlmB [Bacilli bacterium]|nr:23S rRNA (guanosine(2251)-2'-O)-methyltransferase RlmB [Bacilli bacterium]